MNNFNHKKIGRYCYGGKVYAGQCECGREILLDVATTKELVKNSYIKSTPINRVIGLFI